MTNENLLLRLRVESLSANISRLRGHLKSMPDRRCDLSDLAANLGKVNEQIDKARKAMIFLETGLPETAITGLQETEQDLRSARNVLSKAVSAIERMKRECFRIEETSVGGEIATSLEERTRPALQTVNAIEELLEHSAKTNLIWERLRKAANVEAEPIFAEYVEFLGGVALRDTGFDEGISKVADELLRTYTLGGGPTNILAMPTHQQALTKTLARIIRVTFPNWTIWALPATAFEFWRVVASQNIGKTLDDALENLPTEERTKIAPEDMECLGDAYATYTMGPAYAFFAVTILLDPLSEQHHRRTRTILHMLECMDSRESPLNPPYKGVRIQLLEAWNAARVQMQQAPLNMTPDNGEIDDTGNSVLEGGAGVRILVRVFWKTLRSVTSAGFVVDVWNEIQKWVPDLIAGKVENIQIATGAELRHVLNAGWLARISSERDPTIDLTKAIGQLRDKVLQKGR